MNALALSPDYAARVNARQQVFQDRFDRVFQVPGDSPARARLRALLDQIGTVDWQVEGFPSPENQRDLSIKFTWGHNHRFDDDLVVEGRMGNRHIRMMAEFHEAFGLADNHFEGKSILDVGCWTGGTTLSLKMLGAGRITAYEEVRKYAHTAEALLREVFGHDDVICRDTSVYSLSEGSYDMVYIPGVIYHLSDPVLALRRLFNRLHDQGEIFVESAGINRDAVECRFKGNRQHFGGTDAELSRGGWAWFWPSPSCLGAWLEEAGFDDIRFMWSPVSNRVFAHAVRRGFREITRAGLSVPDVT